MSNLKFWDSVSQTNPAHTKPTKIGQMKITAICPQHQRKNATRAFGMYGIGWGINPGTETYSYVDCGDTKLCLYMATMFYIHDGVRGEFPINSNVKVAYKTQGSNGYMKADDSFAKKAQTDALTKGLSFLGFNSDIFEGLFDDNKYVAERTEEIAKEKFMADVTSNIPPDDIKLYQGYVKDGNGLALIAFMGSFPKDDPRREAFFCSWAKGTKSAMVRRHLETISVGMEAVKGLVEQLHSFIATEDEQGIVEHWDDCMRLKKFMMPHLSDGAKVFLAERKANLDKAKNEAVQTDNVSEPDHHEAQQQEENMQ